ncbi:MAG: AAA-like domain-containing protein [Calothrix sp. C42_A2020_038]|nr:AAA-like domain-containing protein [Calothrix sp. C42_A2020_038]
MTIEEVLLLVKASFPNGLTPLQELVLRSSWEGKTYTNIALEAHYGEERVRKVASGLWQFLSDLWQEPIQKSNFRQSLEGRTLNKKESQIIAEFRRSDTVVSLEFPNGPVSLDSRFYIYRPPTEEIACSEITESGGAICIKAPKKMGKSSLLLRIVAHANSIGYRTVSLDFQQADTAIFVNIDKLLRWFCANVSRELGISTELDSYWNQDMGSKISCSIYFQNYLLTNLKNPLVLVLNEVDIILEYPEIARDFLPLLRSWYEQAKSNETWQKLRLVVAHSSEIIIPMRFNNSPFSIGLPIKLQPFNKQQIIDLAQLHGLDWQSGQEAESLMAMVGGHPYLVRLALYYLVGKGGLEGNLQKLLQQAHTESGIYDAYLRQYLLLLRQQPELAAAFYEVITSTTPVKLEPLTQQRLQSLGLIHLEGERAVTSCELFRLYFLHQLDFSLKKTITRVEALERENQQLRLRSNLDELTQLPTRRYFNTYLQIEWQRYINESEKGTLSEVVPLSLIICDIDYFKIYNKTYGEVAGDECLSQIATVIQNMANQLANNTNDSIVGEQLEELTGDIFGKRQSVLVARYSGEEFAILTRVDAVTAVSIAEKIRANVKELAILCDYPGIGGLPANVLTVSIGVSSIIPQADAEPESIIIAAEKALNLAKRRGRDKVVLG